MTFRIGSFAQSQALLSDTLRNQSKTFDTQRQVSSGYKSDDYKGLGREATTLLSAKSTRSRLEAHKQNNTRLDLKLNFYDTTMRELEDSARSLKQNVLTALSSTNGTLMIDQVKNILDRTIGLLNTQLDGKYIFAGTRTDTKPVNITDAAGLLALPEPPTGAFDNNQIKPSTRIDDNVVMEYGMLADEVGQDFLQAMQRILMFDSGTLPAGATAYGPAGSFGNPLTENQVAFLENELSRMQSAADGITAQTAANGIRQKQLEDTQIRQEREVTFIKGFVGEIEDVNLAEAVTRLNQDQVALNASFNVISKLNNFSLLNFL